MQELDLLLDSCRSEFTKNQYACFIEKYFQFVGKNDIFYGNNPRLIEAKIIEYINLLKKEGLSSSGILNYITPVKSFYAINDITLNVKKLGKFLPENEFSIEYPSSWQLKPAENRFDTTDLTIMHSNGFQDGLVMIEYNIVPEALTQIIKDYDSDQKDILLLKRNTKNFLLV